MKRLIVVLLAGFVTFGVARACWAAAYIGGNVGLVMVEDSDIEDPSLSASGIGGAEFSFDSGFGAMLSAGAAFNSFRVEGEFSYRKNDIDELSISSPVSGSIPVNGDIEAMSFLVNGFYDIDTNTAFKPFVGLGVGYSRLDGELEGDSENDNVFAYQFILGTGIAVSDSTNIDISYRYFATSDPEFDSTKLEYASHNIMFGVRYEF